MIPLNEKEQLNNEVLMFAVNNFQLPLDGIHGVQHWMAVFQNCLAIDPDPDHRGFYWRFACLHDVCRIQDAGDPHHGIRMAEELRFFPHLWKGVGFDLLESAIMFHSGMGPPWRNHPKIATCWDADRLELVRVGLFLDPSRFHTDKGRQLAKTILTKQEQEHKRYVMKVHSAQEERERIERGERTTEL